MKQAVKVLQDNRLYGTHVYRKGDVVELEDKHARALLKLGHVAVTNDPPTPLPTPLTRAEKRRQEERRQEERRQEEQALAAAPAAAERAVAKPRQAPRA
jgi:hypothetical protein